MSSITTTTSSTTLLVACQLRHVMSLKYLPAMGHKELHLLPIVLIASPALARELLRMPSTDVQVKLISMAMLITD